jgi:hypothetical protein
LNHQNFSLSQYVLTNGIRFAAICSVVLDKGKVSDKNDLISTRILKFSFEVCIPELGDCPEITVRENGR